VYFRYPFDIFPPSFRLEILKDPQSGRREAPHQSDAGGDQRQAKPVSVRQSEVGAVIGKAVCC
jgi:hypothetical protein